MPNLDRSTISLRFFGKDVEPEQYTRLLGCEPTSAARTGEIITTHSGEQRVIKTGYWLLEYGDPDAEKLETKIATLLTQLVDDAKVWELLTEGCRADLFCGLFLGGWNRGMSLSPALMQELGKRRLELSLDIYAPVNSGGAETQDNQAEKIQP